MFVFAISRNVYLVIWIVIILLVFADGASQLPEEASAFANQPIEVFEHVEMRLNLLVVFKTFEHIWSDHHLNVPPVWAAEPGLSWKGIGVIVDMLKVVDNVSACQNSQEFQAIHLIRGVIFGS